MRQIEFWIQRALTKAWGKWPSNQDPYKDVLATTSPVCAAYWCHQDRKWERYACKAAETSNTRSQYGEYASEGWIEVVIMYDW